VPDVPAGRGRLGYATALDAGLLLPSFTSRQPIHHTSSHLHHGRQRRVSTPIGRVSTASSFCRSSLWLVLSQKGVETGTDCAPTRPIEKILHAQSARPAQGRRSGSRGRAQNSPWRGWHLVQLRVRRNQWRKCLTVVVFRYRQGHRFLVRILSWSGSPVYSISISLRSRPPSLFSRRLSFNKLPVHYTMHISLALEQKALAVRNPPERERHSSSGHDAQ